MRACGAASDIREVVRVLIHQHDRVVAIRHLRDIDAHRPSAQIDKGNRIQRVRVRARDQAALRRGQVALVKEMVRPQVARAGRIELQLILDAGDLPHGKRVLIREPDGLSEIVRGRPALAEAGKCRKKRKDSDRNDGADGERMCLCSTHGKSMLTGVGRRTVPKVMKRSCDRG